VESLVEEVRGLPTGADGVAAAKSQGLEDREMSLGRVGGGSARSLAKSVGGMPGGVFAQSSNVIDRRGLGVALLMVAGHESFEEGE